MNFLTDQSWPWLITIVAVYASAVVFSGFALVVLGPTIWHEGLALIRDWLAPERPANVVDLDERRKQLNAAARSPWHL